MSGAIAMQWSGAGDGAARFESKAATRESPLVKWIIIGISLTFFAVFLLMPLVAVLVEDRKSVV